jgi:hypothetical protein
MSKDGRPLGTSPTRATPRSPNLKQVRGDEPTDDEDECSGNSRGHHPDAEHDDERHDSDDEGRPVCLTE